MNFLTKKLLQVPVNSSPLVHTDSKSRPGTSSILLKIFVASFTCSRCILAGFFKHITAKEGTATLGGNEGGRGVCQNNQSPETSTSRMQEQNSPCQTTQDAPNLMSINEA